ncbi:MAG TPA: hypothetical protein VN688_09280 [Gemmataceae bacterium]|nr:hypothetical protein [Gemmataceae bacterium]
MGRKAIGGSAKPPPDPPPPSRDLLRVRAPDIFQTLATAYSKLLELAVHQRDYASEDALSTEVRELGMRLGRLQAGARDAIELHSRALEVKLASAPAMLARLYVEEGRLLILELMGHLLSYYRQECLQAGRSPERTRKRNSAPGEANRGFDHE